MNHSNPLSIPRLSAVPSSIVIAILIIALLGFADAAYVTIEHYQGSIPPCTLVDGCESVLTSAYSSIIGIPVSLFGTLYYLTILIASFAYLNSKNVAILRWTLPLTIIGLSISLWFLSIMAFVLKAWCVYCLGSAVSSIALFVLAVVVFIRYRYTNDADTNEWSTGAHSQYP